MLTQFTMQWNEQLGTALYSLQTASYSDLFARTFDKLKSTVATASTPSPSAPSPAVVDAPAVGATGYPAPAGALVEPASVSAPAIKAEKRMV